MTTFAYLKTRRDQANQLAKAEPSAVPKRSKHTRMSGPRRSVGEINKLREQMRLPKTMADLQKQEHKSALVLTL